MKQHVETDTAAASAKAIHLARAAYERAVALRRDRIAMLAYLFAQARNFAPGHEADDWRRAQVQVDLEDDGSHERKWIQRRE